MALVTLQLRPTEKQLRDFGVVGLVMLTVIGAVLWQFGTVSARGFAILCAAGAVLFGASRVSAGLVRPVYQGLMLAAFPIGWAVSHVAMAVFFFGLITPAGLLMRVFGRDALGRAYDPNAATYWRPYTKKRTTEDYFHQF